MSHDRTDAMHVSREPLCQAMAAIEAIRRNPGGQQLETSGLRLIEAADRVRIIYQGELVAHASADTSRDGLLEAIADTARTRCRLMLSNAHRDLAGCIDLPPGHVVHADIDSQVRGIGLCRTPFLSILVSPVVQHPSSFHADFRFRTGRPEAKLFIHQRPGSLLERPPAMITSVVVQAQTYRDLISDLATAFNSTIDRYEIAFPDRARRLH